MKTLKSWRWSRLFRLSSLKRVWNIPFITLLCTAIMMLLISTEELTFIIVSLLIVFITLKRICTADDYIEYKLKSKTKRKIHIFYVAKNKYRLEVYDNHSKYRTYKNIDEIDDQSFDDGTILYRMDEEWFMISRNIEDTIHSLGNKIHPSIFRKDNFDGQYLYILDENSNQRYTSIRYDYFFSEKAENVYPIFTEDAKEHFLDIDEFIIVQQEDKFYAYGISYTNADKATNPQLIENIKNIPFVLRDDFFTKIITYSQGNYSLYLQEINLLPKLSEYLLIPNTEKTGFWCQLIKFYYAKEKIIDNGAIETIYEGPINGIHFSAEVILTPQGVIPINTDQD